jgi:hypothetical protein
MPLIFASNLSQANVITKIGQTTACHCAIKYSFKNSIKCHEFQTKLLRNKGV